MNVLQCSKALQTQTININKPLWWITSCCCCLSAFLFALFAVGLFRKSKIYESSSKVVRNLNDKFERKQLKSMFPIPDRPSQLNDNLNARKVRTNHFNRTYVIRHECEATTLHSLLSASFRVVLRRNFEAKKTNPEKTWEMGKNLNCIFARHSYCRPIWSITKWSMQTHIARRFIHRPKVYTHQKWSTVDKQKMKI